MAVVESESQGLDYPSAAHAACPWPMLSKVRAAGSVHRLGDSNRYLVSHYDDVEYVLRSEDLFTGCSEERLQPFDWPGPAGVPAGSLGKRTGHVLNVIELDPPYHKPRRDRMFRLLKPARLASYRPMIEEITDRLIDGFISRGEAELMHDFAYRLPTHLIIRILAFTDEDFDWMHAWGLIEWPGGIEFMTEEERARQGDPGDIGPRLDRERARSLLAGDHGKIRMFLEEALRLESPLQWTPRVARRDVDVGGVLIPEGSYLIGMLQSANRDEAKWGEGACEFDFERRNAVDHLALGKGPHFCIGAPLGRLEAQIAISRLLTRLSNLRLAPGEPTWQESPTFRGLTRLGILFDPA